MRKNLHFFASSLLSIAFIIIVIGSYVIVAQTAITGNWTADVRDDKDGKIQLNLTVTLAAAIGTSRFVILVRRTAGALTQPDIRRDGQFQACAGSGDGGVSRARLPMAKVQARFALFPMRVTAMRSRGFDFEKETSSMELRSKNAPSIALINVTTALADDLKSVGFGDLNIDEIC